MGCRTERLEKQFSCLNMTLAIQILSFSEPVQVDHSPPPEIGVIRDIRFLKSHKAAGPDEINSGDALILD